MDFPHVFHLLSTTPQTITKGGARTLANISNFPTLRGMAIYRFLLRQ